MLPIKRFNSFVATVGALGLIALLGSELPVVAEGVENSNPAPTSTTNPPAPAQSPDPPTLFLRDRLFAESTLDQFLFRLGMDFQAADSDRDGEISEVDAVFEGQAARAATRAAFMSRFPQADLNADGVVTEDELRRALRFLQPGRRNATRTSSPRENPSKLQLDPQIEMQIEREVQRFMAADQNHDGQVTLAEVESYVASLAAGIQEENHRAPMVRQLLTLAPPGKTVLTWPDYLAAAEALFREVDTDANGVISFRERSSYYYQYLRSIGR